MGQQQLILILLVTIIVGIATIVAINNFQEAQTRSNLDAIRLDLMNAHSQSQAYYRRSASMGGGGSNFTNVTLADILLPAENDNAVYEISERSEDSFVISYTSQFSEEQQTVVVNYNEIIWEPEE
ncbi:MAG: hypothetical protein WDZ29_03515 [Balneolaceae bacterium]